jgi:hypothetical protein
MVAQSGEGSRVDFSEVSETGVHIWKVESRKAAQRPPSPETGKIPTLLRFAAG